MAASIEGAFVLIDRASGTMEKMEQQAMKTMAAIEGVGAAQDMQSKRGSTAARAMQGVTGEMKKSEQEATRARKSVDQLGRSHQASAQHAGVLRNALSMLRQEFSRLSTVPGGPRGGGAQSGLKGLETNLKTAKGAVSDFVSSFEVLGSAISAFKLPAMGVGVTVLVQGFVSLAGAAAAALPSIAALASGLNLLPGAFAAAGQGLFSLKAAFTGVLQAAQAGMQAQNQWGYNQREWSQQVVQAQRAVADAVHGVADAVFSQQEALHSLGEAHYAQQQAVIGLSNAMYDQRQAQISLTIARRDAIRTLQDMEFAAASATLREARAGLNIRQAQLELQQAMMTPGTSQLQIESARLGVLEAQSSAQQTHTEAVRQRVDYSRALRRDPTSQPTNQLVQAQHALAQSHLGVLSAQHQVAESAHQVVVAQHGVADAAWAVQRAVQSVAQAQFALNTLYINGNAGVSAYRKQLLGLQPIQRRMVQLLVGRMGPGDSKSLIGQWQKLQESAGEGLFPQLTRAVRTLGGAFPMLNRNMRTSASAMGGLVNNVVNAFFGRKSLGQTDKIMQSNNRVLHSAAGAAGYFADMLRQIMVVAGPTLEWLARLVEQWFRMHDALMSSGRGQDELRAKLARFRIVLTELYHFMQNLWRLFKNFNRAAWDFNQALTQGAIKGTGNLADKIAPGTSGAQRLHDWLMGLIPVLRSLGRLAAAIGKGLVGLTSPGMMRGTARLIDGLTKLVPKIEAILKGLERTFGPGIVSGLQALGSLVATMVGRSGPFGLMLTILGKIVKAFNWLLNLPVVGKGIMTFLAGLFAASYIMRYVGALTGVITKVSTLRDRWRQVGAAQRAGMPSPGFGAGGRAYGAATGRTGLGAQLLSLNEQWGIRSAGPGSRDNPLAVLVLDPSSGGGGGGSPIGGAVKNAERVGADLSKADTAVQEMSRMERAGAALTKVPLIGRFAGRLPGALGAGARALTAAGGAGELTGAVGLLGKVGKIGEFLGPLARIAGPIGAALTVLPAITSFISTKGNVGERASAAGASLVNSLTFGLTDLKGSPTMAQQRSQGTHRADVSFSHFSTGPAGFLTPQGMAQYQRRLGELRQQIYQIQHPPSVHGGFGNLGPGAVDQKKLADRLAQVKQIEADFQAEQVAFGQHTAQNWEQAFSMGIESGKNPQKSMKQMIGGMILQMQNMSPTGRRALQNNVVQWAAELAQQNPKMKKPVNELNSWIVQSFAAMGTNVEIVNGQILDGSSKQWMQISAGITNPAQQAMYKLAGVWGTIKDEAVGSMMAMGFKRSDAMKIFSGLSSGTVTPGQVAGSQSALKALSSAGVANPSQILGQALTYQGRTAGGGRIIGRDPHDVYQLGSNLVGGGELVVNRHQEMDANARLLRHGEPTIGSIVASRNTPHWAYAGGGRAYGGYIDPIAGFGLGRTDQGVDAHAAPGTPIRAFGDSKMTALIPGWYAGQPLMNFQLLSGPDAGRYWYVAEQIIPQMGVGQTAKEGQVVASYAPTGSGIEIGWSANAAGETLARATSGYSEGQVTPAGSSFLNLIHGLPPGAGGLVAGGGGGAAPQIKPLKVPRIGVGGVPGIVAQNAAAVLAGLATVKINNALAAQGGGGGAIGNYSVPGGGAYTPTSWARALLGGLHIRPTPNAIQDIMAWEQQEGGNWNNTARFNPLNTTQSEPGAVPINSVGVKAYRSWPQGFDATLKTLGNGMYGGILGALASGASLPQFKSAVNSSPWGTVFAGGGRLPSWGGWNAAGGDYVTRGPTIFGAGEGPRPERISITPADGSDSTRPIAIHIDTIVVNRKGDVKKIVDEEMGLLAESLRRR